MKTSLQLADLRSEPFRIFFPLATLTGLLGVALWPLHFGGFIELYPGSAHTRLMGEGFFGGFILGFLGTALPRMLSAPPFRVWQLASTLGLYLLFVTANLAGNIYLADLTFLLLLIFFGMVSATRVALRRDMPPPGFILVALAFACGAAGSAIGVIDSHVELNPRWLMLRPLLSYQGFVLLPVLGVGAFLLPRFLGLPNTHDLPESITPTTGWWSKALVSLSIGTVVVVSFFLEVEGFHRLAHGLRWTAATTAILLTVPLHRASWRGNAVRWALRIALLMIPTAFLAVVIWPEFRVALLHILMIGGLGMVTLIVATRVLYGHSGNAAALDGPNRWLWWTLGFILLGMATRVSGDFLPKILASHYNYGAALWIIGVAIWACKALPKARQPDR